MKYVNTTFNTAHKLMVFDLDRGREIGPGYWKMNSSLINDLIYVREIEEIFREVNNLDISNPVDWWDLFIKMVQGVTLEYSQRKAKVKNKLKETVVDRVQFLESIDYDNLSFKQKEEYIYFKRKLDYIILEEIRGCQIRTKGHPRYEINEPDIDFFSKMEKRYQGKSTISELQDENGHLKTKNEDLLSIAQRYYENLFTPCRVDPLKQQNLFKNITKRLSPAERRLLDASINDEELFRAVMQLHLGKSPGPDGITAEFYKKFWYLIKDKLPTIHQCREEIYFW